MANQTIKNGLKAKKITLPQFSILQIFLKILRADLELWRCAIFDTQIPHLLRYQNGPFALKKFILSTNHFYFIYLLALFIVQNSSHESIIMWMWNFWAQNFQFPPMRIFSENLLMSFVSFVHAYLHAKNQSQIWIYKQNVNN